MELEKEVDRDWPPKMEVDMKASRDVYAGGMRLDFTFFIGPCSTWWENSPCESMTSTKQEHFSDGWVEVLPEAPPPSTAACTMGYDYHSIRSCQATRGLWCMRLSPVAKWCGAVGAGGGTQGLASPLGPRAPLLRDSTSKPELWVGDMEEGREEALIKESQGQRAFWVNGLTQGTSACHA